MIVSGTAVTDELISIENAVITILGAEGSKWGIRLFFFFCTYSGRQDTLVELLSATISPRIFLLWYNNLTIEYALRDLKLGENKGRSHRIFTPNKLNLTLQAPNHCAKLL